MAGFTEDDFLPLDELVLQLSNSCKAAASVFEDLTEDLNNIHCSLEGLIKQANNPDSLLLQRCQDRRRDWLHILESLTYALCELQEHISTYYEVGADIWLQADDAQRHFNNLRSEVMVGYDAVDTFIDSLGLSPAARKDYSLGQIEKLLVEAVREERAGTADYGITGTANGSRCGFHGVQRYLRERGVDESEIQRHDARTKQVLIWVLENEPALTDLVVRENLRAEAETKDEKSEHVGVDEKVVETEKGKERPSVLDYLDDQDDRNKEVCTKGIKKGENDDRRSIETDEKVEDLEMTAVLVDRSRPSTATRPASVATSSSSFMDADGDSAESDWELV